MLRPKVRFCSPERDPQINTAVRRVCSHNECAALITIRLILFILNVFILQHYQHWIFPRSRCYTLGGAITRLLNESRITRSKTQARKTQKRSISYVSICIWKIMRSSTLTAYKWKRSNVSEWSVDPESVKRWDTDGGHLLHLWFHNITEYDPDYLIKKLNFLSFLLKPTYNQVLIKTMFEARIKQIFLV